MKNARVWLIAIRDEDCNLGRIDLKKLMQRALMSELRLERGVKIEDEQRRYHILCERIEFYGHKVWTEKTGESCQLDENYLDLLWQMKEYSPEMAKSARLTADFFPRELVRQHILLFGRIAEQMGLSSNEMVRRKIDFYNRAVELGWSIVELQEAWVEEGLELTEETEELRRAFLALKVADVVTVGSDASPFVQLKNQLAQVAELTRQGRIAAANFSELRHDVIAEILHDYVYGRGEPLMIDVIYADGSQASKFPLFVLRPRNREVETTVRKYPVLNVGMMSQRHSQDGLDTKVKVYWYRNQEISTGRSAAEIDAVAYARAKLLLGQMRTEGVYRIGFYQTGFQPVVVGFYRALTEELMFRANQEPTIEVVPFYFMGGEYRQGKPWN